MVMPVLETELPKTKMSKLEMMKNIIRTLGDNLEEWLIKKAEVEPHRIIASSEEREQEELLSLRELLKEILRGQVVGKI